ncbi:transposase, IS605 family [Gloeothece citriformis PCC 7424]|uniref:Transposase, IS605 family n=1 Tax=Gloeothece citriformis (strain PCC 7424) TaxID=65393 RepID=B7KDU2_GLOC7|nr:hypothetical protein [Gloeothece citriformis]ACK70394.1 transposase, IS605 family [Gloeothece citriformis PCC 7424]
MGKSTTPSFVTELPLVVNSRSEKELLSRFQAGRQLYNALLSEAMTRMNLVRNSQAYQEAKKIPKTETKKRQKAFQEARIAYRYSDYDLQAYATVVSNQSRWIGSKVDSNTQQKLATRAFKASEKVMFGQAKRVRFKVSSRLRSLEGKTNKQGIRWSNNQFVWGKLKLKAIINPLNLVTQHGLNAPIKLVRILWRELNGKRRWYVQLVCEGKPFIKPKNTVSDGLIGLDLNLHNLAFVGDEQAGLLPFAEGVPDLSREIRRLQRRMERSRRANNPDNYYPSFKARKGRKQILKKGKAKKGKRQWRISQIYGLSARQKRELERKRTAYARTQNRRLVNEVLRHGKHIKTEKVSLKGWQKRFGKAIGAKSPSFVQSELKRKAENANGSFIAFSTQTTALSQTHLTGERIKKSLSERIHDDVTGVIMQRDLFSAYLSRFVEDNKLSCADAQFEYPRSESILKGAWESFDLQMAKRVGASESPQLVVTSTPAEPFPLKLGKISQIAIPKGFGRQANSHS